MSLYRAEQRKLHEILARIPGRVLGTGIVRPGLDQLIAGAKSKLVFIEWLITKEGQQVINQYGRVPVRDDIDSIYAKHLKQYKLLMTEVDLSQREVEVSEMIRKLFR